MPSFEIWYQTRTPMTYQVRKTRKIVQIVFSVSSNSIITKKSYTILKETLEQNKNSAQKKFLVVSILYDKRWGPFLETISWRWILLLFFISKSMIMAILKKKLTLLYRNFSSHQFVKTPAIFWLNINCFRRFSNWVFAGSCWERTGIWVFNLFYCFTP